MATSTGKPMCMVTALLLASVAPAFAGDYEDGIAAYYRRDYAQAIRLWRPLAENGDAKAEHLLGIMYQLSYGVAQDDAEAVKWYRKAADQGYVDAERDFGLMYYYGTGVVQNTEEAAKWLGRSAEQGDGQSQLELARIHRDGYGVPQDIAQAYNWFAIAAAQGVFGAAEGRDETARKMTPEQVKNASRLVADWLKLHPKATSE